MIKTFDILLELENKSKNLPFSVSQNDLNAIRVNMTILNDGIPLNIAGTTSARIAIKKPSGLSVIQDCEIVDSSKGKISVILSTQAYAEIGKHDAEIYLYEGDVVSVTSTFSYTSKKAILDNGTVTSTNDWQSINDALIRIENADVYTKSEADVKLAEKAKQTDVNNALVLKSDKTYVDTQLGTTNATVALKADKTYVDTQLADNTQQITDKNLNFKTLGAVSDGTTNNYNKFISSVEQQQVIFVPKGTFYLSNANMMILSSKSVRLVGNGDESVIKVGSYFRPQGVDFYAENIKFQFDNNSPNPPSFLFYFNGNGNNKFGFKNCTFEFLNVTKDSLALYIDGIKEFYVKDCKFLSAAMHIKNCSYFDISGNYFDGQFINDNEIIHVNENSSGIIAKNRFFNSHTDFIDLYVNNKKVIVENNYFDGADSQYMEIKVIYRDSGDPSGFGNESNLVGAWEKYIIRNNFFSGAKKGSFAAFVIFAIDYRTTPVANNYQYYAKHLLFEGNIIDDTLIDGTANAPIDTDVRDYFAISGVTCAKFLNNTLILNKGIKRAFYFNAPSDATRRQRSKNILISNNTLSMKYGYDSTINPAFVSNGDVDGLVVSGNIIDDFAKLLDNSVQIINSVFDSNIHNPATTFTSVNVSTNSQITFTNMNIGKSALTGLPELTFHNCKVNGNTAINANVSKLKFLYCEMNAGESKVNFNSGTTTTSLFIVGCILNDCSFFHFTNNGTITNCIIDNLVGNFPRASMWGGTAPAKTNNSTYY